jgi:hypothetical protein
MAWGAEEANYKATSSNSARDEATRAIPTHLLSAEAHQKVNRIIANTSIYRRLPVQVTDCEPDLFQFLVRHPDVVVDIWEVMGISKVQLRQTGPVTFDAIDGAGTSGKVEYLYQDKNLHIIYSEGFYDGPMFHRPIRGQCLLILRTASIREASGRHYITSRLDTFLHLENVGLELLAKTFQSLMGRAADYNFTETANFVGSLSRTAEVNAAGVQRLATKLKNVSPEVRQEFADVAVQVAAKVQLPTEQGATEIASRVRLLESSQK